MGKIRNVSRVRRRPILYHLRGQEAWLEVYSAKFWFKILNWSGSNGVQWFKWLKKIWFFFPCLKLGLIKLGLGEMGQKTLGWFNNPNTFALDKFGFIKFFPNKKTDLRESSFSWDSHDGIGDSERMEAPSGCPLRAIGTVCKAPGMTCGVGTADWVGITDWDGIKDWDEIATGAWMLCEVGRVGACEVETNGGDESTWGEIPCDCFYQSLKMKHIKFKPIVQVITVPESPFIWFQK